jgi:hypothetical protein
MCVRERKRERGRKGESPPNFLYLLLFKPHHPWGPSRRLLSYAADLVALKIQYLHSYKSNWERTDQE